MTTANAGKNMNFVFYADSYHPIQAGSIDGTDILPHDNAVYRAFLCSSAALYDPLGDPKLIGDPFRTIFVGRLSHATTEDILRKAMTKYGRVKNLRLVRHIVTGASRGYGFVEFETEREMRRAYRDAHHTFIDDSEIIVDYSRQQLMPGWIPRRLGGGLGGRKESGQLRFGGRERPFRAPLRPIPFDDLKRLGIPPPPEGRYMSRFQVPSPPRRKWIPIEREDGSHKRSSDDKGGHSHGSSFVEIEERYAQRSFMDQEEQVGKRLSVEREERLHRSISMDRSEHACKMTLSERDDHYYKMSSVDREVLHDKRSPVDKEEHMHRRSMDVEERSHRKSYRDTEKHHKHSRSSKRKRRSSSRD